MTISEFLTSCGVNAPKLAEYLKEKYFAEDETPRHKEWSTRSIHSAKTLGSYSVVLIKDAWWDSGTGIGRSNFFLAVDEFMGQVYCTPTIHYRDQYSEKKDCSWQDFDKIESLEVIRDGILLVEATDSEGDIEHVALRLKGAPQYEPMLFSVVYRGEIFWEKPTIEHIQPLIANFSRCKNLLVREWEVSIGGVRHWPSLGMSLSAKTTKGLKSLEQILEAVEKACLKDRPCREKNIGLEVSPRCISLEKLLGKGGD